MRGTAQLGVDAVGDPKITSAYGGRFARAYLDKENDPILEMDVDLDDGGLSPRLFIDNVEFWTASLAKFERHIGFRK